MGFLKDAEFGNAFQRKFAKDFARGREVIFAPRGVFQAYDLKFVSAGTEVAYEVKSDRLACRTGNLAIEYQCNAKPSGISTSQSDFYVYYIVGSLAEGERNRSGGGSEPLRREPSGESGRSGERVYIIPTSDLKQFIEEKRYSRKVRGGDGWKSEMYLFSLDLFSEYLIKNELATGSPECSLAEGSEPYGRRVNENSRTSRTGSSTSAENLQDETK